MQQSIDEPVAEGVTPGSNSAAVSFYTRLPVATCALGELFTSPDRFHALPPSWHVVVTDIEDSTGWVARGRHDVVNLVAAGCIIAALNIAHRHNEELPFFFGGDGATLLVPAPLLAAIRTALKRHRDNTLRNFGMRLRVGCVPLERVAAEGAVLRIAKVHRSSAFSIPVVTGAGILVAERLVKLGGADDDAMPSEGAVDLDGMECRWDRIKPPARSDEVVCLLVNVAKMDEQDTILQSVLALIETVYGSRRQRNPISADRLRLARNPAKLRTEMRVKLGSTRWRYWAEHWIRTAIVGPAFLRFADAGRTYVRRTPDLSDTLVIDGRISTIVSGTAHDRAQLVANLEALEAAGHIVFGLHVSAESIMSCYVRNRDDAHVHFVDGAGGGYTQAAKILKRKLAEAAGDGTTRG